MTKNLKGRVAYIFSDDNFDVDRIVGIQNMHIGDIEKLVKVMMQEFDLDFSANVKPGDLIVGGVNFGYGHPHYPAMQTMRHLGVTGVVAESFSPIFWNIEVAAGFPQIACPGILGNVNRWDEIEIDWHQGCVINRTQDIRLPFGSMTKRDREILDAGGVIPYLKRVMAI